MYFIEKLTATKAESRSSLLDLPDLTELLIMNNWTETYMKLKTFIAS